MDLTFISSLIGNMSTPAAQEMTTSYVAAVVITGLSVVFLGLIVLIIFVWAFGKIFGASFKNSFKKRKPAPAASPKPVQASKPAAAAVKPKPASADTESDDIIAVIAAAVAAMGASEGKNYRLRSVKAVKNKPSRSAWSMAGLQNDTTPF